MKLKLSMIATAILFSANVQADTNPFTGTSVETEQVRSQLELQREKNSLSKEELEAKRLQFQAKHSEKVMMADLKKMLAPPASARMPGDYPSDSALPGKAKKPAAKPPAEMGALVDAMAGAFAGMTGGAPGMARGPRSAQVSWAPKLVAVMDNGRERVAVVESGGEATTVAVGDRMAMGDVTDIGEGSITIGGKVLVIDKAVVAMNNPDAQDAASLTGGKSPTNPFGAPAMGGGGIMPTGFQPGMIR